MNTGKISIDITDAHIYENHVEQIKTQLSRTPFEFPTLTIKKDINSYESPEIIDLICKYFEEQIPRTASRVKLYEDDSIGIDMLKQL